MKKRQKSKVVLSLFQWTITGAAHTPGSKSGPAKLPPWNCSITCQSSNRVCEHLWLSSTYSMYLWARCVKVTALWFYTIPAYKRFQRNALLLDSGGEGSEPVLFSETTTFYTRFQQLRLCKFIFKRLSNSSTNWAITNSLLNYCKFWSHFQFTPLKKVSIFFFPKVKAKLAICVILDLCIK